MPQDEPLTPVVDLLRRVPLSARIVLDVGCGRGDLLGAYRRMNPTARLLGIERDPVAASVARTRLTEVAVGEHDCDPLPFDVSDGIDCIVYGAALQHVANPFEMLRRHADLLSPNGMMLICVPNVEHWSFVARLLRGGWDYEDSGLLDRSHLRWFSLAGMRKNLLEAGLTLCDANPRVFDAEQAGQFVDSMKPALEALGIDPAEYRQRAAPLQYVWRVRKTPQQRLIVAGNMLAPVGGVSHVRVLHPLNTIASDPTVTVSVTDRLDIERKNDDQPRIFVLHRPALVGDQGRDLLRRLREGGWLVVTEFDDHPDFFQIMQDEEQLTFRGVHAVQTSTPALAEVLRRRNPEVAIFPNAVMTLPDVRNFSDPDSVTLFFGALNREQDWRDLMPALNAAAAKSGDRLRFEVVHDRGFFEALQTPHKAFTPICDYDTYLRLLGQSEISFMPLQDNAFNRAKSDLKFVEAAACRVAALASTVVYGDSIIDGRSGLLFTDADDLREKLLRLVAMPDLARQIGDAARDYVKRERMLAYQVAPRIAWYRSLWARRDQLTAALQDRMATPFEHRP
ncbi:MAG: methyltransferase domain-containing protein [Acetobacteraceae bacterium]